MSEKVLAHIPLNKIRENPVALRSVNRNSEGYLELVDSVKAKGILNPVNVRELKDEQTNEIFYSLVDGLHRTTAARDAGLDTIPAQIIELDEAEVLEAQLVANIHKIETRPAEYSKQLVRIMAANPLMTLSELATKIGKSYAWLQQRLSLTKLDPKIQQLVDDSKINLTNAYALAKLPQEEQPNFVDNAMTQVPAEFVPSINARVKEIKDAKRQGRAAAEQEFIPSPHLQKAGTIKEEMNELNIVKALLVKNKVTDPYEAAQLTLKWVMHLDPDSIQESREKWESKQKAREEAKERRRKEREEKKAQEAAETAVEVANA